MPCRDMGARRDSVAAAVFPDALALRFPVHNCFALSPCDGGGPGNELGSGSH